MTRAAWWHLALMLLPGLVAGCEGFIWAREDRGKANLGVEARATGMANSAAFRDTIGAISFYEGLAPMQVRGYGLVAGLGENGSRDCPKHIYSGLVQAMYKQQHAAAQAVDAERVTPEDLIDDLDTAVVAVRGEIPPGALAGTSFDVALTALPGTQTKSLRGGRLYTTDLETFRPVAPGASITGQAWARAAGPVFMNPFADADSATKSNPREGVVLGGGTVIKTREVHLVLAQPSYVWARRIQDRLNAHFPGPERVADATSPSFVQLRIPREFQGDEAHFLGLVRRLYLSRDPQFEAARARLLGEELLHPAAPHAEIAWCFEGLGQRALPVLSDLYAHPQEYVGFHAAAAGLRLGDHLAGDAMALHARNPAGEYRFQAIRALGEAEGMAGTAMALRQLLHDEDPRVQIAAYEALVKRRDPTIDSRPIARDNFTLDLIPASGPSFVYAKRSREQRIALFGEDLRCRPPILYRSPDGRVTITAQNGDEQLTVLRRVVSTGSVSPPLAVPFQLAGLIALMGNEAGVNLEGEVVGLGLDYGAVVRAVHHLCADGSINGKFILEQPNVAELFGPGSTDGRPESEL